MKTLISTEFIAQVKNKYWKHWVKNILLIICSRYYNINHNEESLAYSRTFGCIIILKYLIWKSCIGFESQIDYHKIFQNCFGEWKEKKKVVRFHSVVESLSPVLLFCYPKTEEPARLLCPWDFPGKNTGAGCNFLLPGIFLALQLNPSLLHCQGNSFLLSHQGSPRFCAY